MNKLEQYIQQEYNGHDDWFVEETKRIHHQLRINKILDYKEYLSGLHKITQRPNEYFNGKLYETRKVPLQYAKVLLEFQTNFLLGTPVTLVGNQNVVEIMNRVYRQGDFEQIDYENLWNMIAFGYSVEYLTYENGKIVSKVLDPCDCYPIYNDYMELIGLVEHWNIEGKQYYHIYSEDEVTYYTTVEGKLQWVGSFPSVGGLPLIYKNYNPLDSTTGRSELEDIIPLVDNMEDLISKFADSHYRHHNPLFAVIGQQLRGDGIDPTLVGAALMLDDGSDIKAIENKLDHNSFTTIYNTLKNALMDISKSPGILLNSGVEISNVSETALRLMYNLAQIQGLNNSRYLKKTMRERFERIRRIMELQGVKISDDDFDSLGINFTMQVPRNTQDIVEDIAKLREAGIISVEQALSNVPYTSAVVGQELERIKAEGTGAEE